MANKTYAQEWLTFSKKNLDTAILLFNANHYEDIIGIELQQCLEKSLKSVMAFENIRIPKEHDLVKLYYMVESFLNLANNEIILLRIATDYYKEDRYPNPYYSLPPKEEIKQILNFTNTLFDDICQKLNIDKNEIIHA
jgi:HEPN domain-containing protein